VLGEVTGQVYYAALCLLTSNLSRCRFDRKIDPEYVDRKSGSRAGMSQSQVSTLEILNELDPSINVCSGIGKASSDKIDVKSAERVTSGPLPDDFDSDDSDFENHPLEAAAGAHDNDDDTGSLDSVEDQDSIMSSNTRWRRTKSQSNPNGTRETKVKFDDGTTSKDSRLESMRQHLLLLSETKHQFLRHCGSQNRGLWTVDFESLVESLQNAEVDTVIERSFGRHGLRLSRILRDKGKLDDKNLPLLALMKKSDVQTTMLAMQVAGFVDVQEVPRSTNHKARDVIHLRFFDMKRNQSQLLDNLYKAMVRSLQTLAVLRHEERNILSFVERKDVRGKEAEVMKASHYNQYNKHLELQSKLLGQVMRLDDLVAILRDF
jgi:DNA-directed RNA polymerase III subunit RPC3